MEITDEEYERLLSRLARAERALAICEAVKQIGGDELARRLEQSERERDRLAEELSLVMEHHDQWKATAYLHLDQVDAFRGALQRIAETTDVDMNGEYVIKDQPKHSAQDANSIAREALAAWRSEQTEGR